MRDVIFISSFKVGDEVFVANGVVDLVYLPVCFSCLNPSSYGCDVFWL